MGVATICLQIVIYVSGRGFVHTYTLMNGPCLQTVIYIRGRGSQKKQSYAMMCSNTSTFILARGVRPE